MLNARDILGVTITNETVDKVSEYVFDGVKSGKKKLFITTPNPEILVYANHHLDYEDKLNSADVNLPDGIGLLIASRILGRPLKTRITGVDFIEKLCIDSKENPVSMGFLGGRGGVAEKAALCLQKKYPWVKVGFAGEEWPEDINFPKNATGPATHESKFTPAQIDILFVAFGHPKQEVWITKHLENLPVKAAMGVGGSFDYLSGKVPRAPKLIRSIGLEWLFRLFVQPWRLKRQLALIEFLYLVLREALQKKK